MHCGLRIESCLNPQSQIIEIINAILNLKSARSAMAGYLTTNVPFMPPATWPGKVQMKG